MHRIVGHAQRWRVAVEQDVPQQPISPLRQEQGVPARSASQVQSVPGMNFLNRLYHEWRWRVADGLMLLFGAGGITAAVLSMLLTLFH